MASADLQILQEKANFTRLSRLLVDKGTEALRSTFDTIHSPTNLSAVLAVNRRSLSRLKPRVINDSQWDLLFPSSGKPPDSKTFDVTLLTVLFRNICGLPSTGWSVMPPDTDRSLQANITRIKLFRNEVYAHVTSTLVDNTTYQSLWQKISQALVELNMPQQEVDDVKISPLGPEEDAYVKMLENWEIQENECMKALEELNKEVKSMKEILVENRDGINELRQNEKGKENDEDILRKLAKHNFKNKIRSKVKFFMPDTRQWLLQQVDWFVQTESESRMLLLTAGPGVGKSVFAAKVCEVYKEKGRLAASHFCNFNNSNLKDPMVMLQSLASQMCENVGGFKENLLDQLKRPHQVHNLNDAFKVYLQNPLDELELEESCLIVIDGLDESAADSKNEIVDLIGDCFEDLPDYIKILVTSRPEITLAKLSRVQVIDIKRHDRHNDSDIELYLKTCLPVLADKKVNWSDIPVHQRYLMGGDVYKMLCNKCEGSFLYAFYVQSELNKRDDLATMTFLQIFQFLPKGIDSIYHTYFKRLEIELKGIKQEDFDVLRILEMLAVSEGPLPLTFITRAIGLAPDCRETKNIINKVNETISCLLYVSNDMVTVFHKSVFDWLLAKGYEDHEYAVDIQSANISLWLLCELVFDEIKRNVCTEHDFNCESFRVDLKYALDHGFQHLIAGKMKERFFWLVDGIIIYILLTVEPRRNKEKMLNLWQEVLQSGMVLSDELRARISWHIVEINFLSRNVPDERIRFEIKDLPVYYLQSIFTHSPKGCFNNEEKKIAKLLSSKLQEFVVFNDIIYDVGIMPLAVWKDSEPEQVVAVCISHEKKLAAVAFKNGKIIVLSVPDLVALWSYSTEYKRIACCVFAPDESLLLFGKLETALSTVERKELPFLDDSDQTFVSAAFSPNGNRLVTCDNSYTVMLWDVSRKCLLSILNAEVHVNWCSFSSTGLYIIGDRKCNVECLDRVDSDSDDDDSRIGDSYYDDDGRLILDPYYDEEDSFCVWNAITLQRADDRKLDDELGQCQNYRKCKHCFQFEFEEKALKVELCEVSPQNNWFVGNHNGRRCIFFLYNHSFKVLNTLFFAMNRMCETVNECGEIAATVDDLQFCLNSGRLILYKKLPASQEHTSCSLHPALFLWNSFSPDGSRLATCVSGGCIEIWDVYTNQVKQRFQINHDMQSLLACWWSEKFLFVFEFSNGVPSLSRYSVCNLKVIFSKHQQMSLYHLADNFASLSAILDFSEGLLSFECGETEPVKVLDVNKNEHPKMISLENMRPMMNITVSPGASFIFGGREKYFIWKRNACKEMCAYDLMEEGYFRECFDEDSGEDSDEDYLVNDCFGEDYFESYDKPNYTCCFSKDSKMAVVSDGRGNNCSLIDLITGNCITKSFYNGNNYDQIPTCPQLFCIKNKILIVASRRALRIYDLDSGARLAFSFQRYLLPDLPKQTKVSPRENMITFPKRDGNMVFVRMCIPSEHLLSKIKRDVENFKEEMERSFDYSQLSVRSIPKLHHRFFVENDGIPTTYRRVYSRWAVE